MNLNESIVEDATLEWFGELGYAIGHGPHIAPGEPAAERESFSECVLVGRLREAIRQLNPSIPEEAREGALRKAIRVTTPSLTQTNRAFHTFLRNGVPVEYPRPGGGIAGDNVRLVNFSDARANDWYAVNQFTVIEGQHNRRPDIVIFLNGLPLGLIELKNAADEDADIWAAYLMQLCRSVQDGNIDSLRAAKIVEVLESFLVRRAVVGLEPTGLHPVRSAVGRKLPALGSGQGQREADDDPQQQGAAVPGRDHRRRRLPALAARHRVRVREADVCGDDPARRTSY